MENETQRWLVQLLDFDIGSQFSISSLPLYNFWKNSPGQIITLQDAFNSWISRTNGKYVIKQGNGYLRVG